MASLQAFLYGVYDESPETWCSPTADDAFGPVISRACQRGFDFTLLFEQSVLAIVPAALLLLVFPLRIWALKRESKKTTPNWTRALKIAGTSASSALQLAVLVLWLLEDGRTRGTIPGALVSLCASVAVCYLSYVEHVKSVQPSTAVALYALLSALADTIQARTLFILHASPALIGTLVAGTVAKLVLLVLESQSKIKYLKAPWSRLSSQELGGFFNASFLWWVNPLILEGYKKLLSPDDLPEIDTRLSSEQCRDALEVAWENRSKPEGRWSLTLATVKAYKWTILLGVPLRLLLTVLTFGQPFIISRAIAFVSEPDTEASKNVAVELIAAAFVVYTGLAFVTMAYKLNFNRLQTEIRGGMVGLLHTRTLTLQDGLYDESAAMTLMSNDTDMVANTSQMVWELWAMSIELIVGMTLLARQMGLACLVPLLFVVASSQTVKRTGGSIGAKQKAWSQATQKRIAMTSSMLGSVKSLKMMGLSETVENSIQEQRREEIRVSNDLRWLITLFSIAANSIILVAPMGTFIGFALIALWNGDNTLDTNKAFTSLALIQMVAMPAATLMTLVPNYASAMAAFDRIQKFLLGPSREDGRQGSSSTEVGSISLGSKYSDDEQDPSKDNDNGIKTILDEPIFTPAMRITRATIRPASKAEPALIDIDLEIERSAICLIAGPVGCGKTTLARAILGELPLDSGEIETTTNKMAYCAQTAWLSNGTIRENICGPAEVSNFDDKWYRTVLNVCGLERDLELLSDGDQSQIGSRGLVLSGGQKQRVALARAVYARNDMVLLDDVLSALDAKTERLVVDRLIGPEGLFRELGTTVILITHSTQYFHLAQHIVVIGTDKEVAEQGTYAHLRSQDGYISKLLVKEDHDQHSEEEEHRTSNGKKKVKDPVADAAADLSRQTGDLAVYGYWLRAVNSPLIISFVAFNTLYAFFLTFPQVWLRWWTEDTGGHMLPYMGGYIIVSCGASICNAIVIYMALCMIGPKTMEALHGTLLHTVLRAPQAFFSETDTGITLNRFSQDMDMVDKQLPMTGLTICMQGFKIIAQSFLLFSAQRYMLTTIPFVAIIVIAIQKVYLQTSRQLRFIDLEAKAPVYSHFLETLEGLTTIRAFGWEREAAAENLVKLDKSQQPVYLLYCIQRWLNLVLDQLVAVLGVLVIFLAVWMRGSMSGGQIGVALNVILVFNFTLLRLAESYTQLETALGAVSRLKNFNENTATEDKRQETYIPADEWPERGDIKFCAVNASYGPDAPALKNFSMEIAPGQKVGICGRTGSGKSSLLSSLLRLLDLDSGTIVIDGLDVQDLPREILRTRMIAIPQDAFIMNSSVRINADPSCLLLDSQIIAALTKVKLWSIISTRGGLDENMKSQPLSHGQQQLFCLARAMLRTSKILILDEATSNVDRETDLLMQRIIREEFAQHTILTVAHRLDTIVDSDMVAVMDAGRLVEFGEPKELLAREDSHFRSLHGR